MGPVPLHFSQAPGDASIWGAGRTVLGRNTIRTFRGGIPEKMICESSAAVSWRTREKVKLCRQFMGKAQRCEVGARSKPRNKGGWCWMEPERNPEPGCSRLQWDTDLLPKGKRKAQKKF